MTKTRRQAKAATSPADQSLSLDLPDDVDEELLTSLLPSHNWEAPTGETVLALYRLLQERALSEQSLQEELDEVRAEVERKDVELDQALQDKEQLAKEWEATLESTRKELEKAKQERDQLAASQASLSSQITTLTASQSSTSADIMSLKQTVNDTEREKRELVVVISRLKEEASQRDEEIQTLRSNLKGARQEYQALESQVRELRSTDTSTKFKLETLTQQLELAQGEAQRNADELNRKLEEFTKFRRDKHQELIELQAKCDTAEQNYASCQSSLKALQSAHSSQTHQLTQALAEVSDLKGKLAEKENLYSSEVSGLRRLVTMMEERENHSKEVVDTLERDWNAIGEKAERREAALRQEIEKEKEGRARAEQRVEQLESVLDGMGRGDLPIPTGVLSAPITPGTPSIADGISGLSPTVAIASRAQKSGKSFTEVYADYVKLQQEYARKSAEYERMDRTLSSVLAQIEERAPVLSQQRLEYERLQAESSELASQLAQAISERDAQLTLAQDNAQKLDKCTRENRVLQQQLDDLGRQIQALLKEIARHDDPSIPSDADLEQIEVPPAENIDEVITNNLVLFKSIGSLQQQNQNLLKIVRELGEKMEADESEIRQTLEKEQADAVREAHEAIQEMSAQLERQKKSHEVTTQAYMKEREALKSMLARAGIQTNGNIEGLTNGASSTSDSDLARELAEVQNQFDTYRAEMNVDSVKLRDEVIAAQREVGQLNAALAKANAKIDFLTDRHRMSQEQIAMNNQDLNDLTKRNEQLMLQYTRVEVECHRALEDLQTANIRVEQLRTETANLKAEKKIWESVQARLVEENRTLSMERSHLSDLMGNVQKMHNDLELSGQNERRRLESQLNMLESQTQDLRNQLTQERDSIRHITLQKDVELKEIQTRLEKAMQQLSSTRESLVRAETNAKHFEDRVNELSRQLQGNEEKLAVYERRTGAGVPISSSSGEASGGHQQLEAEVAELRSLLKVANVDLATERSHVQQFKDISEANEAALAALNTTYDEYKASTEAQIARLESDSKALQEKLEESQNELSQIKSSLNEVQKKAEADRIAWANDKKTLEDTIVDLSTSEKQTESDRTSREHEIRAQEERAKAAEERYSREVVAHAESIKSIDSLKQQITALQKSDREHAAQASAAATNLSASEASWKQQKEALEKEINDLNTRCRDLVAQNTLLHQHLESVSSQAARIKEAVDAGTSSDADSANIDADVKLADLHSIVNYLRKEKGIVDLQLDMSKTEIARLKTQIEHLTHSLQETRETLSKEREKALESAASEAQHADLIERINQLNILRESNATLRAEAESHSKRARELEVKLEKLSAELDPAREAARVAQAELEAKDQQLKRLESENLKWQERNAQLLTKYDRIDPAEVQGYKDQIEELTTKISELEAKIAERDAEVERLTAEKRAFTQRANDNIGKAKATVAGLRENIANLNQQLSAMTKERDDLLAQKADTVQPSADTEALQTLTTERDNLISERDRLVSERDGLIAERDSLTSERDALVAERDSIAAERDATLAEKSSGTVTVLDGTETQAAWEKEKADLTKARDEAVAQVQEAQTNRDNVQKSYTNLRTLHENAIKKFKEHQAARAEERQKLEKERDEAIAAAKAQTDNTASADVSEAHKAELKALEKRLSEKYDADLKAALAAAAASANANKPTDESQEAAIKAAVDAYSKEHADEIEKAVERGRMEAATKVKLKDSQLAKTQKKVKDLEEKIAGWRTAGLIPADDPPTAAPSATPAAKPAAPAAKPAAASGTTPAAPAAAKPAAAAPQRKLPARPEGAAGTAPAATQGTAATRGAPRGRGTARGGAPGRGGAPAALAAAAASAATPSGQGVSIIGAANKRPREEPAGSTPESSLAKRMKPAETTAPAAVNKPPVKTSRPPPEAPA